MKKTKRVIALLLAAVLAVGCLGFAAYAIDTSNLDSVPTVIFDASKGKFEFENCGPYGENQYPDLFQSEDFKNVMPGDSAQQTIRVQVKNAGSSTVKIMLRSGCNDASCAKLLGYYDYKKNEITDERVAAEDKAATLTATLYDGLTGKERSISNWFKDKVEGVFHNQDSNKDETFVYSGEIGKEGVYLGAYTGTKERLVSVVLSIPKTAGNELQNLTAKLDWIFTAEVIPYTPPHEDIPDEPTPTLDTVNHYAYIIGRKDGLVHPEAPITRAEVATIFFRMLTDESREQLWSQSNPYADVAPNMWCNAAVSTMTVGGIVQGYPDGSFRPRANITRAEFAAMAVRFFDVEYDGPDLFSDTTGHWASDLINKAASAGIILGFKDGTFRPDQDITRAEAIAIFNRVLGRAPDKDHLLPDMITWPDNMDTNAWYYATMQEATNSHDYDRVKAADGTEDEVWTKILPVRNWAAFETELATAGSAKNPGDIYSSQP